MTPDEVNKERRDRQIYVKGELVAKPITNFDQLLDKVVDGRILSKLRAQYGITEPTPIQ